MEAGDSARQLLQRVCGDPRGGVLQENAQGAVRVLPEGRESLLLYAASSDMETAQELCGQAEAVLRGFCLISRKLTDLCALSEKMPLTFCAIWRIISLSNYTLGQDARRCILESKARTPIQNLSVSGRFIHTYPDNDAALTMQRREDVELPAL